MPCGVHAVSNGPNEIKTFRSTSHKSIQHWIMLVPMPSNLDYSEYVPQFLKEFKDLYKMPYIKSAYKSGVAVFSKHEGLMNQISYDGNYWKILDNATEKEIMSESFHCLLKLLLDYPIREIVSKMFGIAKDPNTWTDAVRAYAFGN